MSDIAIGSAAEGEAAFRPLTAVLLGALGIVAFAAMLLLASFGNPDAGRRAGGTTAVSRAATGFAGLVDLADATGLHPRVIRNSRALAGDGLTVLTPPHGSTPMDDAMEARQGEPTLLILPKWDTEADRDHPGWERRHGLLPPADPAGILAPATDFAVRRERSGGRWLVPAPNMPPGFRVRAPGALQVITGVTEAADDAKDKARRKPLAFTPIITDGHGGVVLGRVGDHGIYVLADPDLMNNLGTGDERTAATALAILRWMQPAGEDGIAFDVTLDGLGGSRSLLKLAFVPPFLPLTLVLCAAALLALARGLGRFGPPRRRERAVAFGKRALLDNTAALFRMAGREDRLGGRYAQAVRERAGIRFGAPARLRDDELDAYLDRVRPGERFTTLAGELNRAGGRAAVLAAAQALHDWQGDSRTW